VALESRSHVSPPVRNATSALVVSALLIIVSWMIGYSVRQQRAYTANLREQAERRAREQLAEARRAISDQRLQIARELHDVVAHTMSLIAVQAGVGNYVINDDPDEAARALSSIEQISRGALTEMRALLGVLRTDDGPLAAPAGPGGELMPLPGLADLDSLVQRAAPAGLLVDLDIRGERTQLSAGLDLAAYRVVQEAITNVIKHAATDRCSVTVAYQPETLTLQVTDRGRSGVRGAAVGHGIVGMRERVSMYGGRLQAAPLPGEGFQVTARFPLTSGGA
jgi:signal transduction histidine kinase